MSATEVARDLTALAAHLRTSTVRVLDGRRGQGSGVLWDAAGIIATNAHVVRGSVATIDLGGGVHVRATAFGRDESADLAALRVDTEGLARLGAAGKRPAAVRASATLRPGELAFAMGHPLGLENALAGGIVVGCNARWVISDVNLAPGNSGGPLADGEGRVVGINSMVAGGRGLAVPSERVGDFLAALGAGATPTPEKLGVTLVPLAATGRRGSLVVGIVDGSLAARSGLELGDVLLGSDRASIDDPLRFAATLPEARQLEIVRVGAARTVALAGRGDAVQAA